MATSIVTFYSYKGGAGRTTTAVNTIPFLIEELKADKDNPILVVDMDLESAGLTYFYGLQKKFLSYDNGKTIHTYRVLKDGTFLNSKRYREKLFGTYKDDSLVDINPNSIKMLKQYLERKQLSNRNIDILDKTKLTVDTDQLLYELLTEIEKNEFGEGERIKTKLDISILCDKISECKDNVTKVRGLIEDSLPTNTLVDISTKYGLENGTVKFLGIDDSMQESVAANSGDAAISLLSDLCYAKNYKAIIFDSGSGRQSSAHLLHQISDVIVYCMRPTIQFREGTANNISFYKESFAQDVKLKKDKKSVILLPTAVPERSYLTDSIFDKIRQLYMKYPEFIDGRFCSYEDGLCEVEEFKWQECILNLNKDSELKKDEKKAKETYQKLAAAIRENL